MSLGKNVLFRHLRTVMLGLSTLGALPYVCLYTVDGGERAVMFNRFSGIGDEPIGEGTHFKIPWIQYPFIYDIRTKPKVINTTTGTKDLQMVNISLRLLYRPKIEALSRIHTTLGSDFDERVLPSIGNEILKAVVARYDAEKLLTQRHCVSQDIQKSITERANQFDIILDDVAITHLSYGKEYSRAIEEKQVAQQEAERIKFIVQKSEHEKQAVITLAEAEAQAAEMISQALKEYGSGLIEIRRIEAAKFIVSRLAQSKNIIYIPENDNKLLLKV